MAAPEENYDEEGPDAQDDIENLEELQTTLEQPDPFQALYKFHPETLLDYAEKVMPSVALRAVTAEPAAPPGTTEEAVGPRDSKHVSQPFLTLYERTKILGTRANQLAQGALPFVHVPPHVTTPLEIAKMELEQRRLPFIVKRPMPDGTFEYWRLSDLMIL